MKNLILLGLFVLSVTACGGRPDLRNRNIDTGGPDEFSVLPVGALEIPEDLSVLPVPTPGGTNRTDPTPLANAIAALGGRASAASAGGIPASDAALVAAASRNGRAADIRQTLAAEDMSLGGSLSAFFGRILGGDSYFRRYAGQRLDAGAELARLRGMGVQTPTAPPQ